MKRITRVILAAALVCLLVGVICATVVSAAVPWQSLSAGTRNLGALDFDAYSVDSTAFDASSTQTYSKSGSSARLWSNTGWKNDAIMKICEESVDGRSNKYLSIAADPSYTGTASSNQAYALFPTTAVTAPDTDGIANDFLVIDIDVSADKYVVVNSDGTESTFYSSWDEVVKAGKESEAKLAYPEQLNFRIEPAYSGYTLPVYIHSKAVETEEGVRQKSFLSVYALAGTYGQMELSDEPGTWNHITIMYELKAASKGTLVCRAYLDGKYVGKYTKSAGASSVTIKELRMILPSAAINKQAATYSFAIDNWTANVYNDYVPSENVQNSIASVADFDKDYALYNCEDVVYNKDYLSPNGNCFGLVWQDSEGGEIARENIAIGTAPTALGDKLDSLLDCSVKGNYKSLAAWEWNAGSDADEYTPAATLTMDMVYAVRARGDREIILRPATRTVTALSQDGKELGTDIYYNGSEVGLVELETNGWYSVSYSVLENATDGEDKSSFVIKDGKDNRFVVDEATAAPKASLDGVLYNMSLTTNYYMNIYLPLDMPSEVEFLGFYSDAALENKHTENIKDTTLDGASYKRFSFEIANRDIDNDFTQYVAISVTLGGKAHTLSYGVKINPISYSREVTAKYDCKSRESSLVVNLIRYASEAYKCYYGEENASAASMLAEHTSCGCLLSESIVNEYVGDPSTLSDYIYAATYDIHSQNPGMIMYLLAEKAGDVSKITVEYAGVEKDICVSLKALDAEMLDGVSVIPYIYSDMSAANVNALMTINVYTDSDTPTASGTYSLPTYVKNNPNEPVASALYAFGKAANTYKKSVIIPNDSVIIENITVKKESSLPPSMTVSPGGEIEYTVSVTNDGDAAVTVPVYDTVPANTQYISGGARVSGHKLYWSVDVQAGETVEITYKIRVNDDVSLIDGGCVIPAPVRAGGNEAECHENYIELTFGEIDSDFLKIGILANKYSGFKSTALAKWIYNVAFTKNFTMSGEVSGVLDGIFGADTAESQNHREMVIPTLFGGSLVSSELDLRFKGIRAEKIDTAGLVTGDLLLLEDGEGAEIYIYNGTGFISLTNGYESADTEDTLSRALDSERFAFLRPSTVMTTLKHSDPDMQPEELTEAQIALLEVARTYVLRGYRLQYDDTRFDQAAANSAEYRWQIGLRAPEDYTSDEWGYINCAGFTYDLYLNALGHNLRDLYTTSNLVWQYTTNSGARVEWDGIHGKLKTTYNGATLDYKMYPYFFKPTHTETPEEALLIEERIMSELQVGDLIVIRRYVNDPSKSDTGHVMMYIGGGKLVHSTGSSFKYSSDPAEETYEPTIRYMNIHDYLFNPASSNYLFDSDSVVDQFGIVRPLASSSFKGTLPENTLNRIENMQGIVSEKLSSHKAGVTVSLGGEVTYTFRIFNSNGTARTLDITDTVPENSSFVSLTGGGTHTDGALSWTVTVGAGETIEVSYTVKATGESGSFIYGEGATVGGVLHKCNKVYIKRTLTLTEEEAITEAIEYYRANNTENLSGLALANAIYAKAAELLGTDSIKTPFDTESIDELAAGLVENKSGSTTVYQLKADGVYGAMIAPTLYGGERLYTPNSYSASSKACTERTRLGMEHDLVVGDILYGRYYSGTILYIYAGEDIGFVSLANLATVSKSPNDVLVGVIGYYYYFAVLRPSQVW